MSALCIRMATKPPLGAGLAQSSASTASAVATGLAMTATGAAGMVTANVIPASTPAGMVTKNLCSNLVQTYVYVRELA